MKTGLVSCYFINNYGSILQSYALQNILDSLGIANETINVSGFIKSIRLKQYKYIIRSGYSNGLLFDRIGKAKQLIYRKTVHNSYTRNIELRERCMREFARERIKLSLPCRSLEELTQKCESNYINVLIGSDQLWLPANIAAGYYTLNFVPEGINKIAYATSFGVSELPQNVQNIAREFLPRIDHISTREESGKRIIETLIHYSAPVVCDPTLLINDREWLRILDSTYELDDGFIFCYFLGRNPKGREFARMLKAYTGYRIVALIHLDEHIAIDENYADETPFEVGPSEFVTLIRRAKYVCTDSYHCTVFSIIFNKQFFSFKRYVKDTGVSTNTRLDTLLNYCNVGHRLVIDDKSPKDIVSQEIDYNAINDKVHLFKEYSLDFLKGALNIKKCNIGET